MTHPRRDRRSKRRAEAVERQAARDARTAAEQVSAILARGGSPECREIRRLASNGSRESVGAQLARLGVKEDA